MQDVCAGLEAICLLRRWVACAGVVMLCLTSLAASGAAPDPELPSAIYTDPPSDPEHPASGQGVQFDSHGSLVNAQLYRPPGDGVHPTIVLLHGLPGNEQNLDLAQAMRRAGWTVISFHYRGSWGSGGKFSLKAGVEDASSLLALLARSPSAKLWGVDPGRIVLVGHSYGGYVAASAAVGAPQLLGVALIAPWDISFDARDWGSLSAARRRATGMASFDDVDGRLTGATARSLTDDIVREGADLNLTKLATPLAQRRLLLVTATRDTDDDKAIGLMAALSQARPEHLTVQLMQTDHNFNDRRIALQGTLLRWLATLPGAPALPLSTAER